MALFDVRKCLTLKDFHKLVSYLKTNPYIEVVEYIGDKTAYRPRPHGLTKDNTTGEHRRTASSVLNNIRNDINNNNSVSSTYRKLVSDCMDSSKEGVMNPRNKWQIKNLQNKINTSKHISRDDMYTCMPWHLNLTVSFGKLIYFQILM